MLTITVDDRAAQNMLRHLPGDARFAASIALTRAAQSAKAAVVNSLPTKFTIRTGWVAKGIRIKPSDKTSLTASVWSKDKFMALQETGGTKTPGSARSVAIPHAARSGKTGTTTPSKYPRALLAKGKHFIGKSKYGHALYGRAGRGGRKLKLMYGFAPEVKIQQRFGMAQTVETSVNSSFAAHFGAGLAKALKTAR